MLDVVLTKRIGWTRITRNSFKLKFILRLGYIPNTVNPKSFNEKIHYKKQKSNIENLANYSDKFLVREILSIKGYTDILNKLYLKVSASEEINFSYLPDSFVMKANHGSGMIKIVKNKQDIDRVELLLLVNNWLKTKYNESVGGTDFHYDYITPLIIFEKVLANQDGSPILDYKFYCFNGRVEFINIVDNSRGIPLMYIYDNEWNQLRFSLYNRFINSDIRRPSKLEEMVKIAENLSSEFDFVRIDLYLIDNERIVFGEYTFFPGGGMLRFVPKSYDFYYGKKLKLYV